jgi:hypothetical protein
MPYSEKNMNRNKKSGEIKKAQYYEDTNESY